MRTGNRSKMKMVMQSPITMLVLLSVCFFLGKAAWKIHKTAMVSATKLSQAKNELAELKGKRSDLAQKVEFLSSDVGIETELRLKYRAVREGESVVVIVDEAKNSQVGTASSGAMAAAAAMASASTSGVTLSGVSVGGGGGSGVGDRVGGSAGGDETGQAESWWQRIKRFFAGGQSDDRSDGQSGSQ